jgi:hypothetical protein
MAFFFSRLLPPRATFIADMSDDERALMGAHVAFWRPHVEAGMVVALGPVADPNGPYGVAIIETESPETVRTLQERDPVILANRGFRYELFPMPQLSLRTAQARTA